VNPLAAAGMLAVLVASSLWLSRALDPERTGGPGYEPHGPDFYMQDFVSTTMDTNGLPKRKVYARHMAHFPATDSNEFTRPHIVMYRAGGEPWHIRSRRAWANASGEIMLLQGEVHIWRNDADGQRRVDIQTADLRVLPDTQYGETDRAVLITTPDSETRGVGMRAYLDEERMELLARVRTTYHRGAAQEPVPGVVWPCLWFCL